VIHPLLPLILLAGIATQAVWEHRRRLWARVAAVAVAVAAGAWVYSSVQLSYVRPTDPGEFMVQVQSSSDVPKVRDEIVRLQSELASRSDDPVVFQVDNWGGTGWPWAWYLRDLPIGYYDMSAPDGVPLGPVLLVADPNHAAMDPRLDGYVRRRFRLRVWWVTEWRAAGLGDWARWFVDRTAWNPTATMDEWLYVRRDVAKRLGVRYPAASEQAAIGSGQSVVRNVSQPSGPVLR
jgi:predicted membrane-bound mannosyltransferase